MLPVIQSTFLLNMFLSFHIHLFSVFVWITSSIQRSEDNLQESLFSFRHVGPKGTQAQQHTRYPLSHFSGLLDTFFNLFFYQSFHLGKLVWKFHFSSFRLESWLHSSEHGLLQSRTQVQFPALAQQFTAVCHSSSRGSNTVFCLPRHCMYAVHRHTLRPNSHI